MICLALLTQCWRAVRELKERESARARARDRERASARERERERERDYEALTLYEVALCRMVRFDPETERDGERVLIRPSVKFRVCGAGWPWGVGLLTNVGVRVGDWVAGMVGDRARQWGRVM
jgi:hypothetical protein